MGPVLLSLLSILLTLVAYVIYKAYRINRFWAERGIPHQKPVLFLGNSTKQLLMKMNIAELHEKICAKFPNEPVVGFYDFLKPVLLVKDVNLLEKILIKDFMHFTDHGFKIDEKRNPFDASLFTMTGKRWRALRIKLSPIFTSGKLRFMFGPMNDCGDSLISLLEKEEGNDVDIREILGRFAMDVIGSCAFGIDAGNLADPENEFRRMGRRAFEMNLTQFVKFILFTNFPNFFKYLGITINDKELIDYFVGLIKRTIDHRKLNNFHRNDFIQLMLQLQQKGYVELQTKDESDDYLEIDSNAYKTEKFEISDDLILGQALVFLTAGFEATALALTFCLYELSKNPKIMAKIKEEIKMHAKDVDSVTYDTLREMNYLEQCVKETLRKYPPAPFLFRECTKEYALPSGFIIPKGQSLLVPTKTVHYNAEYYPEPNEFRPERFDPDNAIPPCAFIPFGNGPRVCIAMRFALLEVKYALAKLLVAYDFEVSPKTKEPVKIDPTNFFMAPKDKIYLNIKKSKI